MLMAGLLAGGAALGGLYSAYKGNQARQDAFNPYDLNAIRQEQAPIMEGYQGLQGRGTDMYQQGQDLYGQGQQFFDIGSEQNQLMRRSLMDQSMEAIALQNQLAQKSPNAMSGINQANLAANQLRAQGQANQQFLQGYQSNMGIGAGLLGQAMGQQRAGSALGMQALGGQQQLGENIMQGQIANQNLANQRAASSAAAWNDAAGGLFNLAGGGLNAILGGM